MTDLAEFNESEEVVDFFGFSFENCNPGYRWDLRTPPLAALCLLLDIVRGGP